MSKKKLFALVLGACLLVSGTAYALTSSDFATLANSWVSTNCNAANPKYKQRATICYLFHKSNEQQTTISSQQGAIDSLTTSSQNQQTQLMNLTNNSRKITAYDNSGVFLGLNVTPYRVNNNGSRTSGYKQEFFNPSLQKIVSVDENGKLGDQINISYTGVGCTGETYYKTNGDPYVLAELNDRLLKDQSGNYFVYQDRPSVQNIPIKSTRFGLTCTPDDSVWPAIKLNGTASSLPNPVAMPIDLRFE